ncbi:hypothetical protein BRC83_08795 [Halobacteriales archaeon QS_1_68_17]|nr:MAG: hypothetical protein BRC83_08795 [Halobacteriales archaeon QS_1_68_17]
MSDNQPDVADEPALLVCPNGHTTWTATNGHYWCHECSQMHGVDPEFDELHDPETGDAVPASRVSAS